MGDRARPGLTYKDAGVDIDAGGELVRRIRGLAAGTKGAGVVGALGGFSGLFEMPGGLRDPLLVASCDGVGTKLKVAFAAGRHDTVGIDLVAMNVNDLICCGARPLFFLDYLATGRLDVDAAEAVVAGIAEGCRQASCALLGGETAEMPDFYAAGEYDLAGFAVGVVERDAVIDGQRAQVGDVVIGLPSSGLHSNGYSLARRVLLGEGGDDTLGAAVAELGRSLGDELLEPTKIYVDAVQRLRSAADVRALVHVTGGGLLENPPRSVPESLAWRIDTRRWRRPAVFDLIAERGNVAADEMLRTFNMGLGMLAVVPAAEVEAALAAGGDSGALVVGELVERGETAVELIP